MYSPYSPYFQQPQMHQMPQLPQQQIIQVNGKASVDTIQLAPNSSVLVMDTSAPIVWMCVSDGVGRVISTPYDISVHKEKSQIDTKSIEDRISALETALEKVEDRINVKFSKPDVNRIKSKQDNANNTENQRNG